MLSRMSISLFCLGFTAGVIAFGCAGINRHQVAETASPQAEPAAAPPAVQPAAAWTAAEGQGPALAPPSGHPPTDPPPLPDSPARASEAPPQAPMILPSGGSAPATISERPVSTESSGAKVRELYRQAAASYAGIDSYIARLRRREVVRGQAKPEEVLLLKFRKQPWSVYFKWLGPENKGREAVFVQGQHDNKLQTLLAAGDIPFLPAGKVMALDPESTLVRSRSRHALSETGIGHVIEEIGKQLQAEDAHTNTVTLRYVGQVRRPEYVAPLDEVEHAVPPNGEAGPDGGTRQIFFDPATHLPVLLTLHDAKGKELEYYCYDRLQYPVHLDDDDFDPAKLWKSPAAAPKKP